ncbi:relaxase, partial [Bifidobacterium longum]
VSWQYGQWRQWAEWKARNEYGDDEGWDALDGNERSRLVTAVAASTMPRQHVARIVEACAKASRSEDEFIRRVRREGFSIDPRLRRGTAKDSFTDPGQVVGYRITWRSTDGWTERFNAFELGDDMRLKRLRDDWADDARSRALTVQEWRAAMENRPPFLDDGRERHLENLSTHDMERLVSEAFCIAASLNNAADDDEYRAAMREGLHTFDMLRERYGIAPEYGLWSMVASDEENRPRR